MGKKTADLFDNFVLKVIFLAGKKQKIAIYRIKTTQTRFEVFILEIITVIRILLFLVITH